MKPPYGPGEYSLSERSAQNSRKSPVGILCYSVDRCKIILILQCLDLLQYPLHLSSSLLFHALDRQLGLLFQVDSVGAALGEDLPQLPAQLEQLVSFLFLAPDNALATEILPAAEFL